MNNPEQKLECIICKTDNVKTPLLQLNYQNQTYWICPQHMPALIHKPEQLTGMLPGAENMKAG